MKASRAPTRTAGVMVMLGIMIAGSGLILVAGGLFGWLVLLLWMVGLMLIGIGAAKSALRRWEEATFWRMHGESRQRNL